MNHFFYISSNNPFFLSFLILIDGDRYRIKIIMLHHARLIIRILIVHFPWNLILFGFGMRRYLTDLFISFVFFNVGRSGKYSLYNQIT